VGKKPYPVTELTGGLDVSLDAVLLADKRSPNLNCVRYQHGVLKRDLGWRQFAPAIDGTPMLLDTFYLVDGTEYFLLFDQTQAYLYSTTTGEFSAISGSNVFTGDDDNLFDSTITYTSAGTDIYVVTNGNDNIQKYTGSAWADLDGCVAEGITAARQVVSYYNHLFLGFTTEGGDPCPHRIRWSDTDDPEEWDDTTTNAGYYDLNETVDWVVKLIILRDRLFVFKERSIWEIQYVNSATKLFDYKLVIDGVGTYAPNSVINLGDRIIFYGTDGVYLFDGNELEPVGAAIFPYLYESDHRKVDGAKVHRSPAVYIEETGDYVIVLPTKDNTTPNWMLRYNLVEKWWTQRTQEVSCFGYWSETASAVWNDDSQAWDDDTEEWDTRKLPEGAPTTLICYPDGSIWEDDRITKYKAVQWSNEKRAWSAIDDLWKKVPEAELMTWETKDFIFGHASRVLECRYQVKGDAFDVSYSTDGGKSWSEEDTLRPEPLGEETRGLGTYTEVDTGDYLFVTDEQVVVTSVYLSNESYVFRDFGNDHFTDFTHEFAVEITEALSGPNYVQLWMLSNKVDTYWNLRSDVTASFYVLNILNTFGTIVLTFQEKVSGSSFSTPITFDMPAGTMSAKYWYVIIKSGTSFKIYVYTDADHSAQVPNSPWEFTATNDLSLRYHFAVPSYGSGLSGPTSHVLSDLDLGEDLTVGAPIPEFEHFHEMAQYLNVTCQKIRFRVRTWNEDFELKWVEPWYVPRKRSKEVN